MSACPYKADGGAKEKIESPLDLVDLLSPLDGIGVSLRPAMISTTVANDHIQKFKSKSN